MPYTKDEARAEIAQLVANFRANEPSLADAPEAQIEDTYIRRLFRYLNWNTDNTGLAVAEWEFVLQRTDEKGKRPDYILQLDGQPLLVMDAKKVKYDMHDPRWMTQVYAYAYSTQNKPTTSKIDFAILTDFQEFILLDCTLYAADPKAIRNFQILDWTCDDYVRDFDTLWELLEKENLRTAAHTRGGPSPAGLWARYLSPKKVKANRIPPDKAFLAEMDDEKTGWRVRLAKDMKKRNPQADGALITAAVQLLIDRLIFVKALSDREIEDDYLTQLAERVEQSGLAADDAGWFTACRDIFARLNQFYNGSIFEPRPELEAVTVSNKTVRDVIRDLQPEHSPYNFAVLPVEILGTIYERFLGRVVRATDKQVKIEDKPEVRKAGGVYYTPQYIVDYIVQNTVGKLLENCQTPADVAQLKIADPACGSGSFLLGAYSALIHWHEAYYTRRDVPPERLPYRRETPHRGVSTKRDRENYYIDADGRVRLTAQLKRQILLNNLFGVDIDAQAVEVTRFSLSLKALEDTRRAELAEEVTLFQQTVLPDLSANIKCGNSLIGNDYFTGTLFADKDELMRVKPFDWAHEFPGVFASSPPDRTGLKRPVRSDGGFDAVIGNPPYVRQEILGEAFKAYAQKNFATYAGTADLYVYFIEQSHRLLRPGGWFGFIVANKWMRANYGKSLRLWLKARCLEEITDFGDLPVFQSATTYPCVLRYSKNPARSTFTVTQVKTLDFNRLEEYVATNHYSVNQAALDDEGWSLVNEGQQALMKKLRSTTVPLGQYAKGQIYYGIKTGLNEAFVIDTEIRAQLIAEDARSAELIKPFLAGRDVKRYQPPPAGRFIIFTRRGVEIKKYPAIQKYLSQFKEQLMPKPKNWKGSQWKGRKPGSYQWYEIQDTVEYHTEFEKPKIIVPAIVQSASYAFDRTGFYSNDKTSIIAVDDLYLLGLLNSKVPDFVMHSISSTKQGGYFEYKPMYLEQLPIRPINFSDPQDQARHAKMVQLVESMLALHRHKASANTQTEQDQLQRQISATDRAIDALVYELYGLTEDEVRVVSNG